MTKLSAPTGYKRKRPMKRAERVDPMATPSWPCCGRCAFWLRPADPDKDPFGQCQRVVVTESRVQDIEKGTLLTLDDLRSMDFPGPTEPMRTRSWAPKCSLFHAVETAEVIDYPDETPTQRSLFEVQKEYAA